MSPRHTILLAALLLASAGCASAWKPETLWRLNRGTESMNEEAYYSIPARSLDTSDTSPSPAELRPSAG